MSLPKKLILVLLGTVVWGSGCSPELALKVQSSSMAPTYQPGDVLLARPLKDHEKIERFDVIAFTPPIDRSAVFAMRIIALPGEHIRILTNGFSVNRSNFVGLALPPQLRETPWVPGWDVPLAEEYQLGNQELFVIGDNLTNAYDSRYWGPVARSNVVGLVVGKE